MARRRHILLPWRSLEGGGICRGDLPLAARQQCIARLTCALRAMAWVAEVVALALHRNVATQPALGMRLAQPPPRFATERSSTQEVE